VVGAVAAPMGGNRVDTEALKLANPIEEVVARYGVELKRQGRAMVGRCIFHADGGRPNLHIYADSESWRCYRCGIGGDVVAFVMHAEDVGFREAVDHLNGGRAVPVRPVPRSAPALPPAPRVLEGRSAEELAVLQATTSFYHSNLLAEPRALDYLAQRGISPATARQYRLGFAAGDQLLAFLHWQRLPLGAALHLGLLTRAGHEFMADRIVIPELCAGRPMWLIGRALAEDLAEDVAFEMGRQAVELAMAELVPHLGDPVDVQRRLEYSIAPDLEWTVLCYLDLETLKEGPGSEPAPTVVDFKVKGSLITKDQADSDSQAGLYLAGRWLEDYPASELCFAQIAKPGKRRKRMATSLVSTSRTIGQLRGVLARIALAASQIAACHERYGPDHPWGFADPSSWKCSPRFCANSRNAAASSGLSQGMCSETAGVERTSLKTVPQSSSFS